MLPQVPLCCLPLIVLSRVFSHQHMHPPCSTCNCTLFSQLTSTRKSCENIHRINSASATFFPAHSAADRANLCFYLDHPSYSLAHPSPCVSSTSIWRAWTHPIQEELIAAITGMTGTILCATLEILTITRSCRGQKAMEHLVWH